MILHLINGGSAGGTKTLFLPAYPIEPEEGAAI